MEHQKHGYFNRTDLQPDLNMARRFLTMLSESDETEGKFTFQIFPDRKDMPSGAHADIMHGTLADAEDRLIAANHNGCGVFVTVNRTDGKGRRGENIIGIRALFVDLDGAPLQPVLDAALSPHMVIQTSSGRFHAYWIVEGVLCDEFTSIQKQLALQFGGDPKVVDLSRVMRLPGFFHLKDVPCQSTIFSESGQQPYTRDQFIHAFKIAKAQDTPKGKSETISNDPVLKALQDSKLLIKKQGHPAGCWTILCPWKHLHSTQDLGTKYFEPDTTDHPQGGFKCFHSHCADKTLKDLCAYLGVKGAAPSAPLPLHRPVDDPKPFPFEGLCDVLKNAATSLQRVIQAPDAISAQSVSGAASLACQPYANISMDGRAHPLSLFMITVAESGDRKSGTDKIALKPIHDWQKMLFNTYREENKTFIKRKELWECKKKDWMKNPSKGVFNEEAPSEPLHPLVLVEEPTYEGIIKYLAVGQPSIGLFSDEGGRFFGGHAMNSDNQIKTMAGLSSLWDGKEVSRLRGGDGNMLLYGRRLSMHLMIQEVVLEQLMNNQMVECQGFLPRCLVSFPRSTAGNRPYVEEDISKDPAVLKYYECINQLMDRRPPVASLSAPQNELIPRQITLTDAAKRQWILYHNAIDRDLSAGMRLVPIRRFANKAAEHVLRLSGIQAMIQCADVDQISLEDVERGIILMEYYLMEAMRIQGCLSIHPDLLLAQKVLKWCKDTRREAIALQDIYQRGPSQIRSAAKARAMMDILEKHRWVTPVSGMEVDGKRYREAWVIRGDDQGC